MKSEKGVSLISLIIYLLAVTIAVGIVARISTYFYKNLDDSTEETTAYSMFLAFNTYFTKDINTSENYIREIGSDQSYVIFDKSNHQYTFKGDSIYLDNIKICSSIDSCTFSSSDSKTVMVSLKINGKYFYNVYRII